MNLAGGKILFTTEARRHGEKQKNIGVNMAETVGAAPRLRYEELTEQILGAAIEVHKSLGPGLLESAYEECLCLELNLRGLSFERQVTVPVSYKGINLDCGYKLDLLVEDTVILELKCMERVAAIHEAQLLTYMKLLKKPVGFIINFNVPVLRSGIVRKVL
jgi:GxxExxY protein